MIKIATFNVNSIRARLDNINRWLKDAEPDVVMLQELKCTNEQFPYENFDNSSYNIEVNGQKSYNGVAILSKFRLYDINRKLPFHGTDTLIENYSSITDKNNDGARFIEARFDYKDKVIKVSSIYVPNGSPKSTDLNVMDATETDSFKMKINFYQRLHEHFKTTLENDEVGIFCGDYNTCPELIDMYSVKKDGDICCNEKERIEFRKFLKLGYSDVFREFYRDKQEFSWWNYRADGFNKNLGLRLDAILTTPNIRNNIVSVNVEKNVRAMKKASDHAPILMTLDL